MEHLKAFENALLFLFRLNEVKIDEDKTARKPKVTIQHRASFNGFKTENRGIVLWNAPLARLFVNR